jgi:hypothetical protein
MDPMNILYGQKAAKQALRDADIAAREAADRRVAAWDIEIALLDEIIGMLTDPSLPGSRPRPSSEAIPGQTKENSERPADFRRGPKGTWRIIMPEMVRQYPTGIFRLSDVEAAADLVGQSVKSQTVRSQMSNYVSAGHLVRESQGVFKFTDRGRSAFSELSDKPSKLRLVTKSLPTDGAQVDGGTGEHAPPKASHG